jgi:acetyl esterase/lipase
MHKLLLLLFVTSLFLSCKKDDVSGGGNTNTIEASTQLNVQYGSDALQNMDVYLPANRSTAATKVIVMIHGGAWSIGDKADFANFVDTLKRRQPDYAIFNINYRLSLFPNNLFPTQELDTKAVIEYIYSKRSTYLISDKFVLIGASAGAHLSLLQAYKYQTPVKIKAVVDFFGPTDMTALYNNPGTIPQSSISLIVGATPNTNSNLYIQSSPINFITNTSACPTIIFQGDNDPLVNATIQSASLHAKLQANMVTSQYNLYSGKDHGMNWGNETYADAFGKIQSFLAVHNP